VDQVVPQIDKNKFAAWEKYGFDKMFVGDDWKGTDAWNRYEEQFSAVGVEIIYLPHTDGISSTKLASVIKKMLEDVSE
jgi:glycerol-3-phosphate cytidylyltransferase